MTAVELKQSIGTELRYMNIFSCSSSYPSPQREILHKGNKIYGVAYSKRKSAVEDAIKYEKLRIDPTISLLKKILEITNVVKKIFYIEYVYIDDPYIYFSDDNLEAEEALNVFSSMASEEIKLVKLILLLSNNKVIVYDEPVYTFSLFSKENDRKKTAELFLNTVDHVLAQNG